VVLAKTMLRYAAQFFHPVGTCRMGSNPDAGAVVDSSGAVTGTRSLFVADASIMPDIVPINTNATPVMIAEKLADTFKHS
jgi:choline dehydrogenase-like flavoprotein